MVRGVTEFPLEGARYEVRSKHSGEIIASGFERILFGDHGPYVECSREHVNHTALWKENREGRRGKYYEMWRTRHGDNRWYEQLRRVTHKPNPPAGKWAENMGRKEGYADYRVGMWYVAMDDVNVIIQARAPRHLNRKGRVWDVGWNRQW